MSHPHTLTFRIRRRLRYLSRLIFLTAYRHFRAQQWMMCAVNRRSATEYAFEKPSLSPVQQRIIDSLERDGIAIAHLSEFVTLDSVLPELQKNIDTEFASANIGRSKKFLEFLWDNNPPFNPNSVLIKTALSPFLLQIVNAYIGLFARFVFFSVNRTYILEKGEKAEGSQRWHRDPSSGDKRMCKIFIYLGDVNDLGAGPFMYAKGTHKTGHLKDAFPASGAYGHYPQDGEVERKVSAQNIIACTGKAGTVVFCDTTGIHKGGFSTTKERTMITYHYVSPASLFKPNWQKLSSDAKEQIRKLPMLSQKALGIR